MPATVIGFFVIVAAITVVWNIVNGKCPLWVPVLALVIIELLRLLPVGR